MPALERLMPPNAEVALRGLLHGRTALDTLLGSSDVRAVPLAHTRTPRDARLPTRSGLYSQHPQPLRNPPVLTRGTPKQLWC